MSGELAAERWSPAQRVESVLISIISLLDDAEVNSPANVDAGVLLRKNPEGYKKRVQQDVDNSKSNIPSDFIMPTSHEASVMPDKAEKFDDQDFWVDSDEDDDTEDIFGGSDSDVEYALDDRDTGSEIEDD